MSQNCKLLLKTSFFLNLLGSMYFEPESNKGRGSGNITQSLFSRLGLLSLGTCGQTIVSDPLLHSPGEGRKK
jgi:hypothetical protein